MKSEEKTKRYKFHIIMAILIIVYCIGIAPKGLQNDTFYTIKVGEYISQNGIGNLTKDPFSFHDLSYTFPHWLYDLGMYTIYNIGGWDGIYCSTIIFTIILGILIFTLGYKKSKNEIITNAIPYRFLPVSSSFSMLSIVNIIIEKLIN